MKRNSKALALILSAGAMLPAWGCLGGGWNWRQILWTGVLTTGFEYVLDNDGVFDLFEDGNVAAAE